MIAQCGNDGVGKRSANSGKYLNSRKANHPVKWLGLGVLLLAVVVIAALGIAKLPAVLDGFRSNTPEWVATVQNGYLGEFTDMTVYDLLRNYRVYYENEVWDGGTTDDGQRIAEVRYTNPGSSDSATIQFTMLNDDVFRLSAFVDSGMPGAERSDIVYALTAAYYSSVALEYLGDDEKTAQLNALLREAEASEILYGASADYSGDRATLYRLGNDTPLGWSAAQLMECYGMSLMEPAGDGAVEETQPATVTDNPQFMYSTADALLADLDQNVLRASVNYMDQYLVLTGKVSNFSDDGQAFYIGGSSYDSNRTICCSITDANQITDLLAANIGDAITIRCRVSQVNQLTGYEVETISVENITPNVSVQPQQVQETVAIDTLVGTVRMSSGGLKVRSGPGTAYGEIRRLEPGAAVTIIEQQYVNGSYWGSIGDGWICMDYVDVGTRQSQITGGSSTSVSITACVKVTIGELNIRNGPGPGYNEIGRLPAGTMITITELQQSGSTQWGRTRDGWICMDYVDIVYGSQEERNDAQRFVGSWQDQNSKRCSMTIEPGEYGIFVIDISWGNSAYSTSMWRAVGEYDADADCIRYYDCDHWDSVSDGNGSFTNNYYYTGGQGMLYFSGGNLLWQEYNETTGDRCSFVKVG